MSYQRIPRAGLSAALNAMQFPWQYFIDQSLDHARCLKFHVGLLTNDWQSKTIGGRLFCPAAEARWRLAGSEFDLWLLSETDECLQNARASVDLRCYCFGTWNIDKTSFLDGRLPDPIDYPLPGNEENDRFYFTYKEYLVKKPEPTGTQEQIMQAHIEALNQPRVVATRLVGVGVGADPEEQDHRYAG